MSDISEVYEEKVAAATLIAKGINNNELTMEQEQTSIQALAEAFELQRLRIMDLEEALARREQVADSSDS